MQPRLHFFSSTIGKKYLMGLTGVIWAGFIFAHMVGNILLFIGPDAYNSYSYILTSGKFIYIAETVLILALISHVGLAINLTLSNKESKDQRYAVQGSRLKGATLASRTMAIQGSIILFFIITHLITFKFGKHYETTVDQVVMRDIYKLVVEVFKDPLYVLFYVISLILLGFHLSHGFGSVFQSFGLLHKAYSCKIKMLSYLYAFVVAGGFLIQPIFVFLFA
jgi:succinate dehydrogenase / fumarate reductase cytochrome b subunit